MIDALQRCLAEGVLADKDGILRREAEMFFRAGGCVTLTEWESLSDLSRTALIEARELVGAERSVVNKLADSAERSATR